MNVIVIGAGEVGFYLASQLAAERHEVIVVDTDEERCRRVQDQLDVLAMHGNGANPSVLEEAGIARCDMLLAVADRDEVNLVACLAAREKGVRVKIARISEAELAEHGASGLGVDLVINPEHACAEEALKLVERAGATDVVELAGGQVVLLGLTVREGAPVAGRTLGEVGRELKGLNYLTVAIARDEETIIPDGTTRVHRGDQVFIVGKAEYLNEVYPLVGQEAPQVERVMVVGGGRVGSFLGELLEGRGIGVTLIEVDRHRCQELAERLAAALILHGNGTDLDLLQAEGVEGIGAFAALTGDDGTNILSALLAKHLGARQVIALVGRQDYIPLVRRVGIDAGVSVRLATANGILRYLRRGDVLLAASLPAIGAEVIEFRVGERARVLGRQLSEVKFPDGAIVATIIRGREAIIPTGQTTVQEGDRMVVFTLPDSLRKVEKLVI